MIQGVNHITLSVNDIEESFRFYVKILGCQPVQKNPISAYVVAGDVWIALDKSRRPRASPASDYSHLALSVSAEMFALLKSRLIAYGAQSWSDNLTEGDSYYCLDPNGHRLEIAVSNLANRIAEARRTWGDQITWYV